MVLLISCTHPFCSAFDSALRTESQSSLHLHSVVIKRDLKCYRFDNKCETTVSPTDEDSTIIPTAWQNPYFKEQITIVGLNGIIPQI